MSLIAGRKTPGKGDPRDPLNLPAAVAFEPMAWTKPAYSRRRIDDAGAAYLAAGTRPEEREIALAIISNWRSSHHFPLNTLQINLRRGARQIDDDATIAQRIKRLPSIRHKLDRFPEMKLSRMQDIGGCRAILSSVDGVMQLADYYIYESRMKHKLVRVDPYIEQPKESGYRGVHLVWSYFSDRDDTWNGLRIEMQLRSRLQHAWATAVETVGTFTQQALKSSWGETDWLRFFALMSSALARREGTPLVPGTPEDDEALRAELREYVFVLDVVARLNAYGAALQYAEERMSASTRAQTYLLELDTTGDALLTIRSYDNPAVAAEEYSAVERAIEGAPEKDAVLVSVESLASLRRAFPNYFLDTAAFLEAVVAAVE